MFISNFDSRSPTYYYHLLPDRQQWRILDKTYQPVFCNIHALDHPIPDLYLVNFHRFKLFPLGIYTCQDMSKMSSLNGVSHLWRVIAESGSYCLLSSAMVLNIQFPLITSILSLLKSSGSYHQRRLACAQFHRKCWDNYCYTFQYHIL